jgi:hypothetical protein
MSACPNFMAPSRVRDVQPCRDTFEQDIISQKFFSSRPMEKVADVHVG